MKIRSGFVSNSSTSSYVILGIKFDSEDEMKKIVCNAIGVECPKDKPEKTINEKRDLLREKWERLREKSIHYYKDKCGELSDKDVEDLFERDFGSKKENEREFMSIMDRFWDDGRWELETEYHNVFGCKLTSCDDEGNDFGCSKYNMDELNELAKNIEFITGKKPRIMIYMSPC